MTSNKEEVRQNVTLGHKALGIRGWQREEGGQNVQKLNDVIYEWSLIRDILMWKRGQSGQFFVTLAWRHLWKAYLITLLPDRSFSNGNVVWKIDWCWCKSWHWRSCSKCRSGKVHICYSRSCQQQSCGLCIVSHFESWNTIDIFFVKSNFKQWLCCFTWSLRTSW